MSTIPAYRIVKKKYSEGAFDGEGARLFGGRWNSKGNSCVYLAGSESLAILEILVHIEAQPILDHYDLFELQLPKETTMFLKALPENWREEPAPPETAELGDGWLETNISLALAIPSVIVPREWNFILNPNHSEFERVITQAEALQFDLDPRLF